MSTFCENTSGHSTTTASRCVSSTSTAFRAYGNENWEFDALGYIQKRIASMNEAPIDESERRISVPSGTEVTHISWITDQGLSLELGVEFPLGAGHAPTY